jgi:chemotaxis signal transduction protein
MTSSENTAPALLERRAATLAQPVEKTVDEAASEVIVVSVAGGRRYAVETRYVQQVVRNRQLCRLPASGTELLGLVLVKGEAVPVADLASVLGLSGVDPARQLVVVLAGEGPPLGLLVDEVFSTETLSEAEVRLADDGAAEDTALERGLIDERTVLLHGLALLTGESLPLAVTAPTAATHVPTPPTHS